MANGNELRDLANQLRSEENLSTSQIQRDPRYIAKQEEIAEQREQQLDEKANIEAKNLFNVVNNIDSENIDLSKWEQINTLKKEDDNKINIGILGKYNGLPDFFSLIDGLKAAYMIVNENITEDEEY